MAVTPVKYVVQLIDKSTGLVRSGVNVKLTIDSGSTFLPNSSGVNTDSNGIAVIDVSAIGNYDVWVAGSLNTDYQAQPVIPLENNLIRLDDTDATLTKGMTGTTGTFSGTVSTTDLSLVDGSNYNLIYNSGLRNSSVDTTSTQSHNLFLNPNGIVGNIRTSGTSTSFNTSSDPRLKTDFIKQTPSEAWAKFDIIYDATGKFFFHSDLENEVLGFNAHKLIDNLGDAGSEGIGSRDKEIGDILKKEVKKDGEIVSPAVCVTPAGVDQSKIVPYLVSVINDLNERLKKLER